MRRLIGRLQLVAVLAFSAALIGAGERSQAAVQTEPDASALLARAAWLQAYANGDEAALARMLHDEFTVVASTGELASKDEVVAQAQKPPAKLTMTPSDVAIRREGPVAIVTSKVTELRAGGSIEFRVTDVLVRRGGDWQIASSHWTRTAGDLTEVRLPVASLDRLTGDYVTPRGLTLQVTRIGERLRVREPTGQETELTAISPTTFAAPTGRVRWLFIAEPSGNIGHAVIANLNALTPVTRMP